MPVGLHHSARSLNLSTGNEVIGKFNIPADDTNAFGNREPSFTVVFFTELWFATISTAENSTRQGGFKQPHNWLLLVNVY